MSGRTGFVRKFGNIRKVDMQRQPFAKGEFAWADVPKEKGYNL